MPMPISRATSFEPSTHGFHFRNRFSGIDIVKEMSDGLGDLAEHISGSQDFWQGWGLCGGMSWHSLDRYYARNPVPAATKLPDGDSRLFRTLILRQLDSFRTGSLITQCLDWQIRNEARVWWNPRASTRRLTMKEWPKVKASINAGFPAPLCLIRTTTSLSKNHQVVAVAYGEDPEKEVAEIDLYDPNHPNREPKIRINVGGPDKGKGTQSTGERLRGFFVWPYDRTQRIVTTGGGTPF